MSVLVRDTLVKRCTILSYQGDKTAATPSYFSVWCRSSGHAAPITALASLPTARSGVAAPLAMTGSTMPLVATSSSILGNLGNSLIPPLVTKPDPSLFYTGEGLPPIPKSLVNKITSWQFVEMSELLPEYWPVAREDGSKKAPTHRPKVIDDFDTWLQCFALYVGVLGTYHPEAARELMAYLVCISRAKQDYEGRAWAHYDTFYRRNAAVTNNRKWSAVNSSIYSLCFTGKASGRKRCDICRSTNHTTKSCPDEDKIDVQLPTRLKTIESALLTLATAKTEAADGPGPSTEVCRLYNNNKCRYKKCKYRHACAVCNGPHPAVWCQKLRPSSEQNRQFRREATRPYNWTGSALLIA